MKTDLAIVQSAVTDLICMMTNQADPSMPIDPSKCDYNFYGDHTGIRPYETVSEGVNWYLHQKGISALPEEMIISLVAHNFGLPVRDAIHQVETEVFGESGLVDLS